MSITKTGIWTSSNFQESILRPQIYTEADGTKWIKILRHNAPASNLFTSGSDFTAAVYKDENVWYNFDLCNKLTSWELMVKQKVDISSTEEVYRWIQNANPLTATSSQVAAANITRITTTGYTAGTTGGIYKHTSGSPTYLCNHTSWWGACGCWGAYQGGIPGWENKVIKTGYMDVYLRIDNNTLTSASIHNDYTNAIQFIEY